MANTTPVRAFRQQQLNKSQLSGVRDAALNFLIMYTWHESQPTVNQRAALFALEGLRRELNDIACLLRKGAA